MWNGDRGWAIHKTEWQGYWCFYQEKATVSGSLYASDGGKIPLEDKVHYKY